MSTLHITNGDCVAVPLRSVVDGPVVTTCDPLHEGPAPPVNGDAWYDTRARFLASSGHTIFEEARADLQLIDRAISDVESHDEIVLWFEHDLFDQLLIIRTLDLLVRLKADTTYATGTTDATDTTPRRTMPRVSMICLDRFPGIERFVGLGQLTADELASLVDMRHPVTAGQYALATAAWNAFRESDPTALCELTVRLKADTTYEGEARPALPFLGAAITRFLAEYPSVANGLTRTEELALRGLDAGPLPAGALFAATQTREPSPFMGDWGFFQILKGLASARVPLVAIEADADVRELGPRLVSVTDAGRDVIAGRRDAVALNGIDLWRGGVHLVGQDRSPWLWDAGRETLVS